MKKPVIVLFMSLFYSFSDCQILVENLDLEKSILQDIIPTLFSRHCDYLNNSIFKNDNTNDVICELSLYHELKGGEFLKDLEGSLYLIDYYLIQDLNLNLSTQELPEIEIDEINIVSKSETSISSTVYTFSRVLINNDKNVGVVLLNGPSQKELIYVEKRSNKWIVIFRHVIRMY